jgi:hemerythrin-like domain-containing protein
MECRVSIPAGPYADTRDMYMVHSVFRREFPLLPALVRAVAPKDAERVALVADHIDFLSTVLHAHHVSEDVNLWPKLLDRAADEVADSVALMENHHAGIEKATVNITAALTRWRETMTAEDRTALAESIEDLVPLLKEHMRMEELRILPVAEKCVTVAEWFAMAGDTGAGIPPEKIPLMFGMSQYEGDPEVVENTLSSLPAAARAMMEDQGPKDFAAHSMAIHGTATPPRSAP